ncbi:MAG: DUF1906 domain-containing protein [Verrucomicrobia bacterium]|nr:DUF1906 domain-containing protein [Verrucomicrobiota bacterium]
MSKGISTDQNVANIGACLRGEGVEFVFRYYSAAAWKRMEVPEAAALSQAGLKLAVVYEDGPIAGQTRGYFTAARGMRHAQNAYEFASDVIHQPRGSAIYFAVDFDYTNTTDLQGVADYFTAVRDTILQQSSSGGQLDYEVGVYGSGSVCSMVKEGKNLAKYSWLAESTGWDGYSDYKNKCDVLQSVATGPVCQLKDYEFCTANANFGAFSLTLAHLPIRLLASAELLDTVPSVTSAPPLFPPSGLLSPDPLARLGPASLGPSVSGSVVHNATGSSFADPADVATYERCKANGGSEEYCLKIGDNGIGY